MLRFLKRAARNALAGFGFELRRRPTGHVYGIDPFPDQLQLLRGSEVSTIFDVGANLGQTTRTYCELFPNAEIHAFEPCPETFEQLRCSFADRVNVRPVSCAVADRAGPRRFFENRSHLTNSLLPSAESADRYVGTGLMETVDERQVESVAIDEYCREKRIHRIDILKIDTQGGEGLVLEGARGMLNEHAVRLIYSEVLLAPMYLGQSTLWDCQRILDECGYQLFGIYNLVHAGRDGLAWADVIYLPA